MKSEHTFFKPLTLKSDQHLFSPYNITPESLIRVMREENNHQINKLMIVKQILLVSTLGNVWRTVWRICILMLGCKGLKLNACCISQKHPCPTIQTQILHRPLLELIFWCHFIHCCLTIQTEVLKNTLCELLNHPIIFVNNLECRMETLTPQKEVVEYQGDCWSITFF